MKKREHKKRRESGAQQAARSPRAHRAARGLPRTGLRGRPSTERRASRAKGEGRPVPAARRSERAPSPSEPSCSQAEAPTGRPAAGPDEIGTGGDAPTGLARREAIGSGAATVSVAAAAQLLSVS